MDPYSSGQPVSQQVLPVIRLAEGESLQNTWVVSSARTSLSRCQHIALSPEAHPCHGLELLPLVSAGQGSFATQAPPSAGLYLLPCKAHHSSQQVDSVTLILFPRLLANTPPVMAVHGI